MRVENENCATVDLTQLIVHCLLGSREETELEAGS